MPVAVLGSTLAAEPETQRSPDAPLHWLLLGPMGRECACWGTAPELLLSQLQVVQPRATLHLMDLPGTGRLWREPCPGHVAAIVNQLRDRVAGAGLQGPFGLIASSWATAVATEWARLHGDELGALVLISPAMRPFTRVIRGVHIELWPTVLSLLLGRRSPLARDSRLWRSHTRLHEAPAELLQRWRKLRKEHPLKARNGLAQALAVWRYVASRRRPHRHVLLLSGKGDAWLDWRIGAAISRAWGAALRLHPAGGHDLLLDDPQWVARSMAEWLMPVGSGALDASAATGHEKTR